jgi:Tol biopolymer transport system component
LAATTERVSVDSSGAEGNQSSDDPSISADGRFVAFASYATNLVPGDTNGFTDVFVHDRQTGATERVSVSTSGEQGNSFSFWTCISADGRCVAFNSSASNLVPGDTNLAYDVFVHDRLTGTTERVSVDSSGVQGDGDSTGLCSISADGRFVAFASYATNLVPGDTNLAYDVFVHDRQTGATERVSVDSSGVEGNDGSYRGSYRPSISADGRFVGFDSGASNLVPGDTNGYEDIFVHDRQTGATERVSVDSSGVQGNSLSQSPSISADGRYVAFWSGASNLVPGDTNGFTDVFVHDRQTGATERVSVDSAGVQGNDGSCCPSISADGRFVAFESLATNLVPGDTNGFTDVFVHDRQTGATERVSVDSSGVQGNLDSYEPSISADGRFVAFSSDASNPVPGDTNDWWDVFVHDRATAPNPPGISISSGAACTASPSVSLSITCGDCTQVRFRNDPGDWGDWEACAPTKAWVLPAGEGTKRVCAQGRDAAMLVSGEACDEIVLDASPPSGLSISINSGAACADSANVALGLTATGAAEMRFRNETGTWSAWEPFAAGESWILSSARGTKTVGFQARDACGNIAAEVTDTILRPSFDDVLCANSQRPYIEALARQSITSGCYANPPLYCPSSSITRAQMAVFLCKAAGKGLLNRTTPTFADVPKTNMFYGYVERVADAASWPGGPPTGGCRVEGTTKYFCPNNSVTREQMAKFLCPAAGKSAMPSCAGTFGDVTSANSFCRFIERLADAPSWPGGVAVTSGCACPSGYPPGSKCYCPKSNVTRGQMAVFLCRAFGITL